MKQPMFRMSSDAETLIQHLLTVPVGEVATFSDLSKLIGRDARLEGRGALNTARKHLMSEKQIVFGSVRGVGLKRLNDAEIVDSSTSDIRSVHRKSRKAARKMACADYDSLDDVRKSRHNAAISLMGVVHEITTTSGVRRLETSVRDRIPLAKALDLLKGEK